LLVVVVFLFIITGNIFGALLFQDEYKHRIDYSVDGFNTMAEAQIREKLYTPRMEKELNYSSNIAALQQGKSDKTWRSAPSHQSMLDSYLEAVTEEVKSQSSLVDCSPPSIRTVSVEENNIYDIEFSEPYIVCRGTNTTSRLKLSQTEISSANVNNSYVQLSEVGVNLAEHIEGDLPEDWGEGTGSAGTQDRDLVSSSQQDRTDEQAREEAERDSIENENLAEDAVSDFEIPEWVEVETDTEFEFGILERDPEFDTYDYEVCVSRDEEGECTNYDEREGQTYDVDYTVEVTDATLKYTLYDRKKIDAQKDPRKALEEGEINYNDFDIDYDEETRREFNRWESGEITTEEAREQIEGFDVPEQKLRRDRKVLDSKAQLQTIRFKFDYLHEIN
jgi:hypothetical protein